jgi:hypothetical protein
MQITCYLTFYLALDISVPHMMPTAFRAVSTARRLGGSDGRMPGNPRATSALLVARSAGVTPGTSCVAVGWPGGLRQRRHVLLGRSWTDATCGRDNDADRDVTVIPVIPERRSHQERCRGAGHHRAGRPRRARPGGGVAPGCRHARSPVPVAHGALLPLVGSLSSNEVTSSSCALPFLPGCRAFRSWPQARVPAVLPFALARGFARRSPGPVAHHVPPSGTARRCAGRATRLSAVVSSTAITPGTGAAHRLSPPPPRASHQW